MVGRVAGKVHGSLARAGKVRAQTPKVEKKEKKKKKTGEWGGSRLLHCGFVAQNGLSRQLKMIL
jgi:hypothetical protein